MMKVYRTFKSWHVFLSVPIILGICFLPIVFVFYRKITLIRSASDDIEYAQGIAIAFIDYENKHGSLPRNIQVSGENNGILCHSWRAQILSEMVDAERSYNWGLPWDSKGNAEARRVAALTLGERNLNAVGPKYRASVLALSGRDTVFDSQRSGTEGLDSLPRDVVLVIFGVRLPVAPLEPNDIKFPALMRSDLTLKEWFSAKTVIVLFADMQIWVLDGTAPVERLAAFATIEKAKKYDRKKLLNPWLLEAI